MCLYNIYVTFMKILLTIILFFNIISISDGEVLEKFELIELSDVEGSNHYGRHFYYTGNDLFYAYRGNYNIILKNLTKDIEYDLVLPEDINYNGFYSICISNDSLFYNDWQHFHCFKKIGGEYEHQFSTALHTAIDNMKVINDKVYLFDVVYSSDNILSGNVTNIEVIDITRKKQYRSDYPDPSGAGFSFFSPNKVMDVTEESNIVADYDNYRIMFYDKEANPIDSIIHHPDEWIITSDSIPVYPDNYFKPPVYIKQLQPFTGKTSLIQTIDLFNDSLLFVAWSIPDGKEFSYEYRYDLWQKEAGVWALKHMNLKDFQDSNKMIDDSSIPIKHHYRVVNGYLIVLFIGSTKELFINNKGKTYNQYNQNCENYFFENDLKTLIGVYKLK
jgi:hypothetical protein